MTGYGISCWKTKDCYVEVVVQSYNSKYFEVRAQTPPFYAGMEGEFRKDLQKKFHRGSINLFITRNPAWPVKQTKIKWNKEQAVQWKALYHRMAVSLKMENNLNLRDLIQQPGILETHAQPVLVSTVEKNKLKTLLQMAINRCNKERVREGLALKKDFQKYTKNLLLSLQKIKQHSERQSKLVRKNLKEKINDMINEGILLPFENSGSNVLPPFKGKKTMRVGETVNSSRFRFKTDEELIGVLINRMDINEEISRMEEHIRAFRTLIASSSAIGKKMSFYLQEMIREMNTIGGKSQNFKLTQEVVQSKSLIEKLREQVQNVE